MIEYILILIGGFLFYGYMLNYWINYFEKVDRGEIVNKPLPEPLKTICYYLSLPLMFSLLVEHIQDDGDTDAP